MDGLEGDDGLGIRSFRRRLDLRFGGSRFHDYGRTESRRDGVAVSVDDDHVLIHSCGRWLRALTGRKRRCGEVGGARSGRERRGSTGVAGHGGKRMSRLLISDLSDG